MDWLSSSEMNGVSCLYTQVSFLVLRIVRDVVRFAKHS